MIDAFSVVLGATVVTCCVGIYVLSRRRLDRELTKEHYAKLVTTQPGNCQARMRYGNFLLHQNEAQAAVAQFRAALEISANQPLAHHHLGQAMMATGDLFGAIDEFRAAVRLDPELAEAHSTLGALLEMKGDLNGARQSQMDAIRANPRYATAHYKLARVFMKEGNSARAYDHLAQAVQLSPDLRGEAKRSSDFERLSGEAGFQALLS